VYLPAKQYVSADASQTETRVKKGITEHTPPCLAVVTISRKCWQIQKNQ
jgi:hypothetical protein